MSTNSFDALTRRASLVGVGTAAMSTLASTFVEARNANRKSRKRIDTKARKTCHTQAGQCTSRLEGLCANDPGCLALIACCEFAGRCDFTGYITCTRALSPAPP